MAVLYVFFIKNYVLKIMKIRTADLLYILYNIRSRVYKCIHPPFR